VGGGQGQPSFDGTKCEKSDDEKRDEQLRKKNATRGQRRLKLCGLTELRGNLQEEKSWKRGKQQGERGTSSTSNRGGKANVDRTRSVKTRVNRAFS